MSVLMEYGDLFAMDGIHTNGVEMLLQLCADNWDINRQVSFHNYDLYDIILIS